MVIFLGGYFLSGHSVQCDVRCLCSFAIVNVNAGIIWHAKHRSWNKSRGGPRADRRRQFY